jgi:hypothetical protein
MTNNTMTAPAGVGQAEPGRRGQVTSPSQPLIGEASRWIPRQRSGSGPDEFLSAAGQAPAPGSATVNRQTARPVAAITVARKPATGDVVPASGPDSRPTVQPWMGAVAQAGRDGYLVDCRCRA